MSESNKRMAIGSDHYGLPLKNFVRDYLISKGYQVEIFLWHNAPVGAQINVGCGSTHPEVLQAEVFWSGLREQNPSFVLWQKKLSPACKEPLPDCDLLLAALSITL